MSFFKAAKWLKKWASYIQRAEKPRRTNQRRQSLRLEELEPRLVLNSDWYVVPGSPLEEVNVTFKRSLGSTPYRNELDVYIVSDDAGRVDGLLPTDAGYAAAVNRNSKVVFNTSSSSTASTTLVYPGGTRLGFSLVQNASSKTWQSKNPTNSHSTKPVLFFSFDGANPDGADHVQTTTVGSEVRYRWEDRTSLADRDFNDMMYSIKAELHRTFTTGKTGQVVPTTFTLTGIDSSFQNEVGIYFVDDAQGTIGGIAPGQSGYAKAALTAATTKVLFARGTKKGATLTVILPSEKYFGLFLVQNSTTANFLTTNPGNTKVQGKSNVFFSFTKANPDKFDHLHWYSNSTNTFGFEDLYGGGDKDFNDLVAKFSYGTPFQSNTPPSISDIANQTVLQNTPVGPISFTVNDQETSSDKLTVSATTSNPTLLPVGNILLSGTGNNRTISLNPIAGKSGVATITLTVKDAGGLTAFDTFNVTVVADTTPPVVTISAPNDAIQVTDNVTVTGNVSDMGVGVAYAEAKFDDGSFFRLTLNSSGNFSFPSTYPLDGTALGIHTVTVRASDNAGNVSSTVQRTFTIVSPSIPSGTFGPNSEFLYTGPNPVQTGVEQGTINPIRAAIIRGKVIDRASHPLTGVAVTVLNHPEFGQTTTQVDGTFNLVANGGGLLTVVYTKAGFLPVQSQVNVPWQDYVIASEVALTPLDSQVTTINLDSPLPIQVAQGSVVTDSDGSRQATLLFPQGTSATMTLPNGTVQPLTSLNVRATEYTVGDTGPEAMPGTLPAASAYTYCVELSVDQAQAAGATQVNFSQAIPFYVQNFLNFPVGMAVPVGNYDRTSGLWIPSQNGVVIKVLSITSGEANLDTDGDGNIDNSSMLNALGITENERTKLATIYQPGQTLWRVQLTHFSIWDCNWPYGLPDDAVPPNFDSNDLKDDPTDDPNQVCQASTIGIENQTLAESIPITGTPFTLNFSSDRTAGNLAARTLTIPLTQQSYSNDLKRVVLTIEVAGKEFQRSFNPSPNLSYSYTWNGLDAFSRAVQGSVLATVRIGYVYKAVYGRPVPSERSFGQSSGITVDGSRARQEITLTQTLIRYLGTVNAVTEGLGGWTLDVQHAYSPSSKTIYYGTGETRVANNIDNIITNVGPGFGHPQSIAVGPDGSLYITDTDYNRVRRISPDGMITTILAGNSTGGFSGDGGPATQARLLFPYGVAVGPDGSVYIADTGNHRIREVSPDGIITTVAGNGTFGFSGDGGPATQAMLSSPHGIAVGPEGSLYIVDTGNQRIRKVSPDGIISTVVGNGVFDFSGDGGPAMQAAMQIPRDVAVGRDGSLYIAELYRIRKVGPDGIITTVAGNGLNGLSGDGIPATQVHLEPYGVAVGQDGSLFIAGSNRIRRVNQDGIITTVAGNGRSDYVHSGGNGVPATQATLGLGPNDVAVAPDGSFYLVEHTPYKNIWRVSDTFIDYSNADIAIPSKDGSELYHFDNSGRHLQTLDALTHSVIYSFAYDSAGRLASVIDGDGNVTSIEHDANGNPTAIVSPFGQRTVLTVNAQGYLATVTNPANEKNTFSYSNGGLLTNHTDARGNVSTMGYDLMGRLIHDEDAAGGSTTLTRQELGHGSYKVTTTNAVNGTRQYLVENLSDGSIRRTTIDGRGFAAVTLIGTDGTEKTTLPNGTVTTTTYGPDPRFGMMVPIVTKQIVALPSGLTSTSTGSRTAVFSDPTNPQSNLISLTDKSTINGQAFTTVYTAATHTVTTTSAEGRSTVTTLDARGRVTTVQVPGINATQYSYDSKGRISTISQGSRSVIYAYDSLSRLNSITDPLNHVTNLAYDAANRIVSQTQPDGTVIGFSYDSNGNMISLTPPGESATTFAYDPHNELLSSTPPSIGASDETTSYVYNLAHQLVRESLPGGDEIDFAYCECGRLTSIVAPWGTYTYTYSATTGELSSLQSPGNFTISISKDGILGTSETLSGPISGAVSWNYNQNFQVTSELVNGANPISFSYDHDGLLTGAGSLTLTRDSSNGRVTGTTLGTVTDALGYDQYGDANNYQASIGGTAALQVNYTRDLLGRITRKVETIGGTTVTYDYDYDLNGQLVSVDQDGVRVQTYAYDANGNRLSLTTPGGIEQGAYNVQDQLLTYGTKSYTYAPDGSLISMTDSTTGQTTRYSYDAFGNLTQVNLPDGRVITYLIDGNNRRVGKEVNGVLTQGLLYDGQLTPVAALDPNGSIAERFVYATGINVPAYMIKGGITFRIITDNLGSVRLVINTATGQVAQRVDYDAFGRVTLDTNPGFQPFGYAGGLYDTDTELVRFGARDLEAECGRWLAKDPIGFASRSTNVYNYVNNTPTSLIDAFGLQPNGVSIEGVPYSTSPFGFPVTIDHQYVVTVVDGVRQTHDSFINGTGMLERQDDYARLNNGLPFTPESQAVIPPFGMTDNEYAKLVRDYAHSLGKDPKKYDFSDSFFGANCNGDAQQLIENTGGRVPYFNFNGLQTFSGNIDPFSHAKIGLYP